MRKIFRATAILLIGMIAFLFLQSHIKPDYEPHKYELKPKLSDYGIYDGDAVDLLHTNGFTSYSPASGLFTDCADKQRLVRIPQDTKIKAVGDGLPEFPEGMLLVKTFYYSNTEKGRKLIETRVMINTDKGWVGGVYKWNESQTDAFLIEKGDRMAIVFIDASDWQRAVNYKIPQTKDCAKCHKSQGELRPLGFTMRNLNHDDQLQYLMNKGLIERTDAVKFGQLPDWKNPDFSLEERARVYLDVNCAHCHADGGYCSIFKIRLGYGIPIEKTHINEKSDKILKLMKKKKMPYIGITIIDEEGFALVKQYLKTLE